MAFETELEKDMKFYSTLHAQNLANTIVSEIEDSVALQLAKIDDYTAQLLRLIPDHLLDATGEQLLEANFDIGALLAQNKENLGLKSTNTMDSERCSHLESLSGSQIHDHKVNQANKQRWKTPNKKQFDSATKGKHSSNKKTANHFKGNRGQACLSSGKKLNWRC